MITNEPITQTKLFGLNSYMNKFVSLYSKDRLPNKILLSGQKGLGKSTLAFHFINSVLSKNEKFEYNLKNFEINPENHSFKTFVNKSNLNVTLIDISLDKTIIDISQIRKLILNLQNYSLNEKPRFVLIDNIEFLNTNSINALLKVLEEPAENVYFFLVNNNKKILPTLLSRCINFKISLSNNENISIAGKLLDGKINDLINKDLINYYSTPGNIYNLVKFAEINDYNIAKMSLLEFLKIIIKDKHYKKDFFIKNLIFDFIEFYFSKINLSLSSEIHDKYNFFLKRIADTKKFNLDEESLFMEFEEDVLNG